MTGLRAWLTRRQWRNRMARASQAQQPLLAPAHIIRQHMPLQAGTRLGPYEVLSLIGAGGMGEVYQARDTRLDRKVAVKVLAPELAS